jgi:tetratricopeptide (TPR) repeat protein
MFPRTQAFIVLGEAYEKTGGYSQALEAWETASYIKPSLFKPLYNMAKLYFKLQNYEQARQKASEILNKKIKIDNPEINQMKREAKDILNSTQNKNNN